MSDQSDTDYATEYDYIHLAQIVQSKNLHNLYDTDDESEDEDAQSVDPDLEYGEASIGTGQQAIAREVFYTRTKFEEGHPICQELCLWQ
ncbi:hypothetical protein AA0112_g2161 [Alternaria arborescens]|nr:hypothetical protein AA0112_g2161 [Alternaria arborescens]